MARASLVVIEGIRLLEYPIVTAKRKGNMNIKLRKRQVDNRVRWVRALLSGDYEQGKRSLKRLSHNVGNNLIRYKYEYCCLGVACEIVAPNANELKVRNLAIAGSTSLSYMKDRRAARKFGMSNLDQSVAVRWNDSRKYDFERIADLIAYATKERIPFVDVPESVPVGYATTWLEYK